MQNSDLHLSFVEWSKAPDFALQHIFISKIIFNYFIVKFIKMYSLIFINLLKMKIQFFQF